MRRARQTRASSFLVPLLLLACDSPKEFGPLASQAQAANLSATLSREPIQPLPQPATVPPELAALGKRLFNDPRLSKDDSMACSGCHDLAKGGDGSTSRSLGVVGKPGLVNAPTVYNAALNLAQFWDGRAPTLEDQVDGPITHPLEMASSWEQVLEKLGRDTALVAEFRAVFADGLTQDNVKRAIAAYERTLITTDSPFDQWLGGDETTLSDDARTGYELFQSLGCIACHQGANVGGNMYQRLGVLGDYFGDRGNVTDADYGRFNVTGREEDRFVFRVPSLRVAVHTAPYFHDGAVETLQDAVQTMAKVQLGRRLDTRQVEQLTAFIGSLAGPLVIE